MKIVNEAMQNNGYVIELFNATDILLEELHKRMQNKNFGSYSSYQQIGNYRIKTTSYSHTSGVGPYGANSVDNERFWQIEKKDSHLIAYEIDSTGKQIGQEFAF